MINAAYDEQFKYQAASSYRTLSKNNCIPCTNIPRIRVKFACTTWLIIKNDEIVSFFYQPAYDRHTLRFLDTKFNFIPFYSITR